MSTYAELIDEIMKRPLPDSFSSGPTEFGLFDHTTETTKEEEREAQYREVVRQMTSAGGAVHFTARLKKVL